MKSFATANWKGTGKEGNGTLSSKSKVLENTSYDFRSRFEDGTFGLVAKQGDSNKSFSYHLYLKQTLEQAIAGNKI